MVFSGLTFLFLFLPAVLLVYFVMPKRGKNAVLFAMSLVFYAWGEPVYVCLMIFSTILDYTCGRLTERYRGTNRKKLGLILSLIGNIGLLAFFKYVDFFLGTIDSVTGLGIPKLNLPLPIGISFYTFQTMSYTIDVYRGDAKAQTNVIDFGAYVSLFPQLIAGPIVRYRDIAEELKDRKHCFDNFGEGARRFVTGLAKKVLLANNIGLLWDKFSAMSASELSALGAWTGIVAFAFQIYFDFSGYSDMAIGLGKMLGFTFPENFDYPYISKSVTEFWRRWHMTLGKWFRDYVYIPLGGNRDGLFKQIRNVAIVWVLTGFWHGASWNFVLWGVFYGILLIIEKLFLLKRLQKLPAFVGHLYTMFAVLMGWVLFAFDRIGDGFSYYGALFGRSGLSNQNAAYLLLSNLPLLLICLAAATPIPKRIGEKLSGHCNEGTLATAASFRMFVLFGLSVAYLISGSYNPFLYFRF